MKWLSLFLAFFLFDSTRAAVCIVPGQKHHGKNINHALFVRGGDLGPVKSKTLAMIFCGLVACDAVGGALAPSSYMKLLGVDIAKGSLSEHFVHGIGASAATAAVSTYLAISGTSSIEKAIGCGFVARLVSMTVMIITNRYHELGMNNAMFGMMWAVLAVTTYSIFSGNWEPMALTQLVSLLLGFHGVFLFLKPEKFMKRATTKGEGEPLAKDIASIDGGYMAVSALVTGLLASGMNPEKVAGYASLVSVPVLLKFLDVGQIGCCGISSEVWIAMFVTVLAAITTGTVLDV